jgi:hypothetical protein
MDQVSLVSRRIEAGARFLGEFQKYLPVRDAFWLKESDESDWILYVASDKITDDNFDVAYGEVARIAGEMRDPWFDPFRVKLIGKDAPLARAAAGIRRPYPGPIPTHFSGSTFGGVAVDDVFFYPAPTVGASG